MIKHPLAPTPEDYKNAIMTYDKYLDYLKNGLSNIDDNDDFVGINPYQTVYNITNPINKYKTEETEYIDDYNNYCKYLKYFRSELECLDDICESISKDKSDEEFIDIYLDEKYRNSGSYCHIDYSYKQYADNVKTNKETDYIKILTFYKNLIQIAENLHNKTYDLSLEQTIFLFADFDIIDGLLHQYDSEYIDILYDNTYNAVLKKVHKALDCIIPEYESSYFMNDDALYIEYFICDAIEKYFDTHISKSDILYALNHKISFDV